MTAKLYTESAMEVMEALEVGTATVSLGRALPDAGVPYAIIMGAQQVAVRDGGGYVISLGLTRAQVQAIHASCVAILKDPAA